MYDEFTKIVYKIIKENGDGVLVNERRFLSIFSDYAPEMEKETRLLKLLINSGAFKELVNVRKFNHDKQNDSCNFAINCLKEEMISSEIADKFVCAFADGIGIYHNVQNVNSIKTNENTIQKTHSDTQKNNQSRNQFDQYVPTPVNYKQKNQSSNAPIIPIIIVIVAVVFGIVLFGGGKDNNKDNDINKNKDEGATSSSIVSEESVEIDSIKQVVIQPYEKKEIDARESEELDITGYTTITDSVEYDDEKNTYYYTTTETGYYGLNVTSLQAGNRIKIRILDEEGYELWDYYALRDTDVLMKLEAGETCKIIVRQVDGYGDYTLEMSPQKATVKLTYNKEITDHIEFIGQRNNYTFKPGENGDYSITLTHIPNGKEIDIFVYDEEGYVVESKERMTRDKSFSFYLENNQVYTIKARGFDLCEYSFEFTKVENN